MLQTVAQLPQSTPPRLYQSSNTKNTTPVLQGTTPCYKILRPLQGTAPVPLPKYYSNVALYYIVLLRSAKWYSSTAKYYSILPGVSVPQSANPVVQTGTTVYYKVPLQNLKSTTPVLQRTTNGDCRTVPYCFKF